MLVVKISKPDREKILKNDELIQAARELVKQTVPDYEQAYKLLDLAYKQGSPEATYAIATWNLHGGHFLKQDYVKGTKYLKKATKMKWPYVFSLNTVYAIAFAPIGSIEWLKLYFVFPILVTFYLMVLFLLKLKNKF